MQSVIADDIGTMTGGRQAPAHARPLDGIVLPRVLRRPFRRLLKSHWNMPRYLGTKGVAAFLGATVGAGVVIGGHATDVVAAVTTWAGLGIDQIRISGQSLTVESDVLNELGIGPFPSLLTFDLDAAKARVETLPWVAEASIQKLYPHELSVTIREREPFAVWQDGDTLRLIDGSGRSITDAVDGRYAGLPMVVGTGAAARIGEFSALVASAPAIAAHARAGVLVGERRWTIVLDSGIELMLPEQNAAAALQTVAKLDADKALLSRAISTVDLRAPDNVVLRLDADGLAARTAMLKARAKSGKAKI